VLSGTATTVRKLADELGVEAPLVQAACRRAGVHVLGEASPLDEAEVLRVRAALAAGLGAGQWQPPDAQVPPAFMPTSMPPPIPTALLPPPPPGGWAAGLPQPVKRGVAPWLVVVLTLVAVVAAVAAAVVLTGTGDRAEPADAFAADAPVAAAVALSTGDCWSVPGTSLRQVVDGGFVFPVALPCDQPHQGEVYAMVEHGAPLGEAYPGDDALTAFGVTECAARFEGFVGAPLGATGLDAFYLYPTPVQWDAGLRTVSCSVYALDGTDLVGTAAA
jgi:hypothetical protein